MIGYKAFNSDLTCRGFQYEIGKSYEMDGEIEICERGFHFCENIVDCFRYYDEKDTRFAKVEAYGDVINSDFDSKCVTNKIRILEEIPRDEAIKKSNTGHYNTGHHNSGDFNSGDSNSGDYNSGRLSSGNYNSGDHNSGDHNTGHDNTGDFNSGDYNSGNYNSGRWNTGDHNTGDWNKSSYSAGCFMTTNSFIMMFNKPSNWTFFDWVNSKAKCIMALCPRERNERQMWWDELNDCKKAEVMSLPNFDPDVFYECTGIVVKKEGE